MSIAVIINPVAGGAGLDAARRRAELASAVLAERGERCEVFITERRGHARELAAAAIGRGSRLVIGWGGDGTINEVASALAFGQTPMGIVPSGSGNGLAKELHIGLDPARAIAAAAGAEPRSIDLGEIAGRLFVNLAGIGFDAHVAARFDRPNARRGFAGYVLAAAPLFFSHKVANYRVIADGAETRTKAVMITIANGPQFGNGACVAPGARFDDGLLDLVMVGDRSRLRMLLQTPKLFTGGIERVPGCSVRRVREVSIESDVEMAYHVDGEPFAAAGRLDARVHPGALRVCA